MERPSAEEFAALEEALRARLSAPDGWAELTVTDDGVGGARTGAGSGLRGLADRIDALGGELTVVSDAGSGTTVRARVPTADA
jgi:signal transduction histidine kinase